MPGKKAMVVISNGNQQNKNGYLTRTEEQLKIVGVKSVVFDKVEANPLKSTVMTGSAFAKENNCDFIVALGGGSCIDASKAIAVMATNIGDYWDYIPSGSGYNNYSRHRVRDRSSTVITNQEKHEKSGFLDENLSPVLAIVDPELMITVPPKYTAYQGFDALFHSLEGYISNGGNIMSDICTGSIENVGLNLAKAVKNGNDFDAREKIALETLFRV